MGIARRPYFFRTAVMCLTLLLASTARMVASVGDAFPGAPPSATKVASETPAAQKKLTQRMYKSIRPSFKTARASLFLSACIPGRQRSFQGSTASSDSLQANVSHHAPPLTLSSVQRV